MKDATVNRYPPPQPGWTIGDALLVLVIYFFVVLCSGTLISMISNLFAAADRDIAQFFSSAILQYALYIGLTVFFVCLRQAQIKDLGFSTENINKNILLGVVGGVILLFLVTAVGTVINQLFNLPIEDQYFTKTLLQADNGLELLAIAAVGCILAPFGEELYFRGFVYPALKARLGKWPALILVALFFGAIHMDVYRLLPLALGGFGLAWLYEKSGSILTSMIAHAAWNSISVAMVLLL